VPVELFKSISGGFSPVPQIRRFLLLEFDAVGYSLFPAASSQSLILPVVCQSELSTSSLTDARRIKPGGVVYLLFSSPLGQTNSGLTE
jgi:hypothetical protein